MEGEHGLVRMMLSGLLLPTGGSQAELPGTLSSVLYCCQMTLGVLIKDSSLFVLPIPGRSETMDGQEPMYMAQFLLVHTYL